MQIVILQMAALIACGIGWRLIRPGGLDADSMRQVLTTLVYNLLLPALVLKVLWTAPLGVSSIAIAGSAAVGVLASMGLSLLICHRCRHNGHLTGAVVLAASFPNVTYMGLPVLVSVIGESGRSLAIQYDLFANTPLLLTLGVLIARHFGEGDHSMPMWKSILRVPPFGAALAGVLLNFSEVPLPAAFGSWLEMLAVGVIPLMLFSIGLSLKWEGGYGSRLRTIIPITGLQLILTPAIVWLAALLFGLRGEMLTGTILEAAMPSMVLGLVLCDRYKLDSNLYAAAVTITTLLSLLTLPLWVSLLT